MEVGGEGGIEAALGSEVGGDTSGELVVAAMAEGAAAAGYLVVAVVAGGVEWVVAVEGLGGGDLAALGGAADGGGWREGGGWDA